MENTLHPPVPPVSFGEECHPGLKRDENQDSVAHGSTPHGELFVISDGVGGYYGGAEASAIVTEGCFRHMRSLPPSMAPEAVLTEVANRVNAEAYAAGQSGDASRRRMSATLVMALLLNRSGSNRAGTEELLVGNIGDSRAYLVRDGSLTQLTIDHTAVQGMIDAGVLTPAQAENHPHASILTQSVGQAPEAAISLRRLPLQQGDQLLLCSDGLHGYVEADAIFSVMTNPQLNAPGRSRALLDLALAAGGADNISVQVIGPLPARSNAAATSRPPWLSSLRRPHGPIAAALVGGGALVLASWGGLALYRAWQSTPAGLIARAPIVSGVALPRSLPAIPLPVPATKAPPSSPASPTQSATEALRVGQVTPAAGTERDWADALKQRLEGVTEVGELQRASCTPFLQERPTAYYREENVRDRFPATDPELKQHYIFRLATNEMRDCGNFDLLLLPPRSAMMPQRIKTKVDAGESAAKEAKRKVTDILQNHSIAGGGPN